MGSEKSESVRDGVQERRRYERTPVSSCLGVVINGETFNGECKNLGKGGVLVVLSNGVELKARDKVVVTITQHSTSERPVLLQLEADAVWAAQPDADRTRAGLRFLVEPDEEVLRTLGSADEAAVQQKYKVQKGWKILDWLQKIIPEQGIEGVCWPVEAAIRANRELIGHVACHIWYYDPGRDMLVWKAGHGSGRRPDFQIRDKVLRQVLVEEKTPVLEADDVEGVMAMPPAIWSAVCNWILPLSCRNDFFGVLYFAFDKQTAKPFEPTKEFWFCHSLANYLAQAMERAESSHDNHLRLDLLRDLPVLIGEAQMEKVYERIIADICEITGCKSGVFRLYDPDQDLFTVCAKLNIGDIDQDALCYGAGPANSDYDTCPLPEARNPDFCEACEACRNIIPPGTRALRTTFWDSQRPDVCIGQVCSLVGENLVLEGRLARRLQVVSSSLASLMETALHQVMTQVVHDILAAQRSLASGSVDTRGLLEGLVTKINKVMKAQSCELFLADPQCERLSLGVSTFKDLEEDAYDKFYSVDDTNHLTSLVAKNKKALAIPNVNKWHTGKGVKAIVQVIPPDGAYSFVGVPFFREGETVGGVIRCCNKNGYPGGLREEAAFHRHDIQVLKAIAESCSPLILATTGEQRMSHRLVTAGHEVTATAVLIQQKASQVMSKITGLRRTLPRVPKLSADFIGPLEGIYNATKGIKDAAAMVAIYQDDVSVSLSNDMVSWVPRPTNLYGDVIAQVVDMLRDKAKSKGVEIDYDPIDTAPKEGLLLDPSRMKQLFYNLLTNAIKLNRQRSETVYQISDSETVKIERCRILIRSGWSKNRKSFFVAVISDGREIFEDEKDHIWEYGFRGRAARGTGAGLGIGMYIAKKIEKSAKGLDLELTRRYDPVVFTVRLSYPILP